MKDYKEIFNMIKERCSQSKLKLSIGKLENDGGICKLKDNYYVILNQFYPVDENIKIFFDCIKNTEFEQEFNDIKEIFIKQDKKKQDN